MPSAHARRAALRSGPSGRARVLALAIAVALIGGLIGTFGGIAPAGAASAPNVALFAYYNGAQSTGRELPVDASFDWLVNYSCTVEDCTDFTITVPFPAGLEIGNPSYGADIQSVARVGSTGAGVTLTFTLRSPLTSGTTGQLSIPAHIPAFVTPDNTSFTAQASMESTTASGPTVSSAPVTMTARADIIPSAQVSLVAGGAINDVAIYSAAECLGARSPFDTWGYLGTEPNSTKVLTLPEGAVYVGSEGGGVYTAGSPGTVTWNLPAINSISCPRDLVYVRYPSSDPANTVGAVKSFGISWTVAKVGGSPLTYIANGSHAISAASGAQGFSVSQSTPRAYGANPVNKLAIGDSMSYQATISNSGVSTWDPAVIDATVPGQLRVTSVGANNAGQVPSSLSVRTTCGPDRVAGTSDDGDLELVGTLSGSLTFDPDVTWPSSAPGLDPTCFVTDIHQVVQGYWPNAGSYTPSFTGVLLAVGRTGVVTHDGDQFSSSWHLASTTDAGTQTDARTLDTEVDTPKSTLAVRNFGPGTLAPGVTEGDASFSFSNSGNPLANPVMSLLLPLNTTIVSWSGDSRLPTPTRSDAADWGGTGRVLVNWTWPLGTTVPINTGYTISYRMALNDFAFGNLRAQGFVDSASTSVLCVDQYFGGDPDTFDKDGDGNVTEVPCRWDADIAPNPAASASLTTKIKGAFDSGFVAGPATGETAPGSNDQYQIVVKNNGRIVLDNVNVVDKLPRAGDTNTISTTARNEATNTFPVVMRASPTTPAGLGAAPTVYYSTVVDSCQPELAYNPSGCNAPDWTDWSATPPSALSDVTMVRVDFGANTLEPGRSWTIGLPVTTPTSGATEPDFAAFNPDPLTDPNEAATNTAAFVVRRADTLSALTPAEPPGVTLEIPGALGPVGPAPTPSPITTSGIGDVAQPAAVVVPTSGSVHFLDGGAPVTSISIPAEGTYSVDPSTGEMSFQPEPDFVGIGTPVTFEVMDGWGQTGTNTWTATVTLPPPPTAPPLATTGPVDTVQSAPVTWPGSGSWTLMDGVDPVNQLVVAGVGTYTANLMMGSIDFDPLSSYFGTPPAVRYRVVDAYGQSTEGDYQVSVTIDALTASPLTSHGTGVALQSATAAVPTSGTVTLLDGGGNPVTALVVAGQGTYTLDPDSGLITFQPVLGFAGPATPVGYRVTDSFARTASNTYAPTVLAPAPPPAPTLTSASSPGHPSDPQTATITIPPGGSVTLVDGTGTRATTVVVPGEGTFVLDPATGIITFTPAPGYRGAVTPVGVRVTDAYGQSATGSYAPTIARRPVSVLPIRSATGSSTSPPTITVSVPPGGSITLLDASGHPTDSLTIASEGTYDLDPATGVITFRAIAGYTGSPTPAAYVVTNADGDESTGYFAPTVLADEVVAVTAPVTPAQDGVAAITSGMAYTGAHWMVGQLGAAIFLLLIGFGLQLGTRRRRAHSRS